MQTLKKRETDKKKTQQGNIRMATTGKHTHTAKRLNKTPT